MVDALIPGGIVQYVQYILFSVSLSLSLASLSLVPRGADARLQIAPDIWTRKKIFEHGTTASGPET